MSYRCTDPFLFNEKMFQGGALIPDDHPILETHGHHFTKVSESAVGSETAMQGPGEVRTVVPADDEAKATAEWLAAEAKYEEDVQAWLFAEEQYETDVAAWLAAEAEATVAAAGTESAKSTTTARGTRTNSK